MLEVLCSVDYFLLHFYFPFLDPSTMEWNCLSPASIMSWQLIMPNFHSRLNSSSILWYTFIILGPTLSFHLPQVSIHLNEFTTKHGKLMRIKLQWHHEYDESYRRGRRQERRRDVDPESLEWIRINYWLLPYTVLVLWSFHLSWIWEKWR